MTKLLPSLLVVTGFLAGCTSSLPIIQTGNSGEYLVVARNSASIFSSIEIAQKEAVSQAVNYCIGLGKMYVKKYVIDRPMALGQVPESNLYFTCTDSSSTTTPTTSELGSFTLEQAKIKCLDLGFKIGTESFGQCILKLSSSK